MTAEKYFQTGEEYFSAYENNGQEEALHLALLHFSKAIALKNNFADAYYKRALVYGYLDMFEEEFSDLEQASALLREQIDTCGESSDLYYKLALVYMSNFSLPSHIEKALENFETAIKLDAQNFHAYYELGQIYKYNTTDYQTAISYYDKVIELNPTQPEFFLARAECYQELKEYEIALDNFNKAIRLDPENSQAFNRRGELFLELSAWEKAAADYKMFRSLTNTDGKMGIELLRHVEGGLYFELFFAADATGHQYWDASSLYLHDDVFSAFYPVFIQALGAFDYYGTNEMGQSELSRVLAKMNQHFTELNSIDTSTLFLAYVEKTGFIRTLIREYDGFELEWEHILTKLKIVYEKLIELLDNAITKNEKLIIYGI